MFFYRIKPPSINICWPFIYDACSDAKNATSAATSSGLPYRRSGIARFISTWRASGILVTASVSMVPGATQFTVMLRRPYSTAIDFDAAASAPLDAAYADRPASPLWPAMDVILIMRPYLFFSICGSAACIIKYGVVKFMCITRFNKS